MKTSFLLLAATFVLSATLTTTANAQQTYFKVTVDNVGTAFEHHDSGVFAIPDGSADPAPIGPGAAYSFTFDAAVGQRVSFASMFIPSNDLFFGPGEDGIALYADDGTPVDGDVTDQVLLWDAGTEVNQEPGVGGDQPQRQAGPNSGDEDSDNTVRLVNDGFSYPHVVDVVAVSVTHNGGTSFTVRIENVSTGTTLTPSDGTMQAVPLAPGVFVVHSQPAPLFTKGEADRGLGLEAVAEDGGPGSLSEALGEIAGVTQILAPVAWVVHTEVDPFFSAGESARHNGLEMLAEDGGPGGLAGSFKMHASSTAGASVVPVGAQGPGPIGPGGSYTFTVSARPGASLSIASMVVQSNDLFLAPDVTGIPLWDESGDPIEGEITDMLMIWDAGTEVNEVPGFGPNQAPRQPAADTGPDEGGVVQLVDDGFTYPQVADFARVRIMPVETVSFTVRVENVSTGTTLTPSDGSMQAVPMAPGAFVVHTNSGPIFMSGDADRGYGLEDLAEDGSPGGLAAALAGKLGYSADAFAVPDGAEGPAPIGPGGSYLFTFDAAPGSKLSLATMFIPSNDLFYSSGETGIPLWDENGVAASGDVTEHFSLWDAGTEINQEPGVGPDQAQRQSGPNTGADDPDSTVRMVNDGFAYPATTDVIRVTIESVSTAAEEVASIPESFRLHQNHPNPFNPTTNIGFELQESGSVRLSVYDVRGQLVAELVNGFLSAGSHTVAWNGRRSDGGEAATGTYLYRIELGSQAASTARKMILLR